MQSIDIGNSSPTAYELTTYLSQDHMTVNIKVAIEQLRTQEAIANTYDVIFHKLCKCSLSTLNKVNVEIDSGRQHSVLEVRRQ